jgi:hypothetical protein
MIPIIKTGIILVNTIRPGDGVESQPKNVDDDDEDKPAKEPPTSTLNIIMDLIRFFSIDENLRKHNFHTQFKGTSSQTI